MTPERVKTIAFMIESDAPGGAEILLLHAAEEMRSRGYEIVPLVPSWKSGWLGEQFRKRGFHPREFLIRKPLDWEGLRELVSELDQARADVIHSHEFSMAIYGTAAARILRRRHVITMHGDHWSMTAKRRRIALRWAFRLSSAAVAVSEDTRRFLMASLGLGEDRVRTVPNGIPKPQGDPSGPRREFRLGSEEVVLLAAGNLWERKGHLVLLKALNRLAETGCETPWRLIIAGEGEERPRLDAFVHEHRMGDRVHLPGHRTDIGNLQAAADILVMPSLWEGLPLAILEGMHAGNAVIGSNISGIPEAIRDGVEGLLVPPGDDQALAAALRTLIEDRGLRQRMGAAAQERASTRFSIRRIMDDYEALYLGRIPAN